MSRFTKWAVLALVVVGVLATVAVNAETSHQSEWPNPDEWPNFESDKNILAMNGLLREARYVGNGSWQLTLENLVEGKSNFNTIAIDSKYYDNTNGFLINANYKIYQAFIPIKGGLYNYAVLVDDTPTKVPKLEFGPNHPPW
jgi:hypothetical protein